MVDIQIRERNGAISDSLRAHVQRRLDDALARFGARVARVIVRFSDGSGARAADKRCQIHVGLHSCSARVEDTQADAYAALDRAAERIATSVAHVLERERAWAASKA